MGTHTFPTEYLPKRMSEDDLRKWSFATPRNTLNVRIQSYAISISDYEDIRNNAQMNCVALVNWPSYCVYATIGFKRDNMALWQMYVALNSKYGDK